jgi:hypothetical protein
MKIGALWRYLDFRNYALFNVNDKEAGRGLKKTSFVRKIQNMWGCISTSVSRSQPKQRNSLMVQSSMVAMDIRRSSKDRNIMFIGTLQPAWQDYPLIHISGPLAFNKKATSEK